MTAAPDPAGQGAAERRQESKHEAFDFGMAIEGRRVENICCRACIQPWPCQTEVIAQLTRERDRQRDEMVDAIMELCEAVDEAVARPEPPKTVMYAMIEIARRTRAERDRLAVACVEMRTWMIELVEYDDGTFMRTYQSCRVCLWTDQRDNVYTEHQEHCPLSQPADARGAAILEALTWYADPANHDRGLHPIPCRTKAQDDAGARARLALGSAGREG